MTIEMSTIADAVRGMAVHSRARIGRGTSAQGFYAQRLRFRDLAFDIGAWRGQHTAAMIKRGARVVAVEPQAELARQLERNFPAATVVALGVSDQPGQGELITPSAHDDLATLNPESLNDPFLIDAGVDWDVEETIRLTALDDLIAEFGIPAFVKTDTEGHEDRVFAGLSQPVEQFLFEVRSALPDVAARAFERLAGLGSYEYRLRRNDHGESWVFGPTVSAAAVLGDLPNWGDVYARQVT